MAAVMLQVIPSFYTSFSKTTAFFPANTYEENIVSEQYCIARHDDKMCFLPNCRYHIILIGNIKNLLQIWMHSVSTTNTWTVCIHFSSTASVAKIALKRGQLLDNLQRAVDFNQENTGVDRMPSIAKKRPLRKKVQEKIVELLPKDQIDANKRISVCTQN